jgi:methyl-accepting chemotaxis protein
MAAALTIVSVRNADKTYTNKFKMQLGDDFSISYDGKDTSFGGSEGEKVKDAIDIVKQLIPSEITDDILDGVSISASRDVNNAFQGAEREFAIESIVVASAFVVIGLFFVYLIVRKALKPVRKLSETVKRINENNLYEKLEEPGTTDEIASLTTS